MFFSLFTLWFIRETKAILFWLYLWQLKEYHIGRFLDHFQTEKGRQLLLNKLVFLKIFLLLLSLALSYDNWPIQVDYLIDLLLLSLIFILFGLYFLESFKVFKDFLEKTIKKPVWTKKSLFLTSISLIPVIALFLVLLFGNIDTFSAMLAFDILTPAIVSVIVLFFQPFAVLGRNQIIKKASEKRAQFQNLLVIGITGSYGKTSTKEFLATILSERFKVLKTAEHQNSEVGISQCILNDLKPEHEIFICEMGAYNRGGIKLLCDIAKPKIGILTGINEQHMAIFGSQKNIVKGKYELIESLPEDGLAIFNGDNEYCFELYKRTLIKKRVYGLQSSISGLPLDILAYNVRAEKDFITFRVALRDEIADFKVNLMGSQNISNVLAAVICARELGMTLEEISKACQKIESWQSGFQLKKGINGLNIIDATYSANPDGVISHLEYLKIWSEKKVIVMPCLIELGRASKEVHKRIGQKIGEVCDLSIITTKDRFEEIQEGAGDKALFIENPKEIFEKLKSFCNPSDLILLESRVPSQLVSLLVE
ncbi:hypothetical protein GW869_00420 [bacterium]|nr:hypothetical protein [bacterium]